MNDFIFYYTLVLFVLSCFTLSTIHQTISVDWGNRFFTMFLWIPIYGRIFGWW